MPGSVTVAPSGLPAGYINLFHPMERNQMKQRRHRRVMTERQRSRGSQRSRVWAQILGGILVANIMLAFFLPNGDQFVRAVQDVLWKFSGAFALVGLSLAVMMGLACTDRLIIKVEHRIVFQSAHRAMAFVAVGFLFAHIALQVAYSRVDLMNTVIPFGSPDIAVALGPIGSNLFILIVVTGILRARFANSSRPWLWRTIHVSAYMCWPVSMIHGLNAGRPAPDWVTLSYAACLVGVGLMLLIRLVVTVKPKVSARESDRAVDVEPVTPPARSAPATTPVTSVTSIDATPMATAEAKADAKAGQSLLDDDAAFWATMRQQSQIR